MRKIGLIVFVLLMCCISGAAFAQDAAPTFCGTLSEADCAIVTNAQSEMQNLDSLSYDLEINFDATNIPDMDEPMHLGITGNGSFTGVDAVRSAMHDMSAFETDPGAAISSLLSSFDADMTLVLALPAEMMGASSGIPSEMTFQIRLVDGVAYLNLDPLQPVINDPSIKGWYGLDIANMIKDILAQMPEMLDEMQMFSMSGSDSMAYMEEFSDPEFLAQFVSISRTDDGSGDVATFETTVDLGALMSSPEFQDMMKQQMQAQMEMQGQSVSKEDMAMGMQMSEQMMQGVIVTVVQDIGTTDGYVHSVHGSMSLDTAGMMAAISDSIGEGLGGTSSDDSAATEEAPVINIDFSLDYSDFNSAAEITAPEDATVFPYQMLLQGMMGDMGGGMSSGAAPVTKMTPTPTASS